MASDSGAPGSRPGCKVGRPEWWPRPSASIDCLAVLPVVVATHTGVMTGKSLAPTARSVDRPSRIGTTLSRRTGCPEDERRRGSIMRASRVARVVGLTMAIGMVACRTGQGRLDLGGAGSKGAGSTRRDISRRPSPISTGCSARQPTHRDPQPARHLLSANRAARRRPSPTSIGSIVGAFRQRGVFSGIDLWFAESFGNRGIALLMLGRDQEALESFQQARLLVEHAAEPAATPIRG